ncbi:MAG TPA: NrfD/PsrC family molybdoenzyme membrane anchor subunit, partial [Gemmatimonadaceae bacterium]|nr:NrfD/PsrC family molybdoenzyme membrane anchor subunit [Gemmatimonadaceae bacterium]
MSEITTTRANPLVDPAVHVWHAEIPIYLFLGGLVAGLMVLAGLRRLRGPRASSRTLALLPWAAPLLLTVGMLFLWLDLENRWNVLRFYLTVRPTSPMSWGSWILVAVYPVSILVAWLATPADLRRRLLGRLPAGAARIRWLAMGARRRERGLAWASIVLGASLGIYTGVLLGTMAARPLWNSGVLGPLFLVSGLSSAAAFVLLTRVSDEERVAIGRLDMGLMLVEALL